MCQSVFSLQYLKSATFDCDFGGSRKGYRKQMHPHTGIQTLADTNAHTYAHTAHYHNDLAL